MNILGFRRKQTWVDLAATNLPDEQDFISLKKANVHDVDVNSFNISSTSCFPPYPFSPPRPRHEGQLFVQNYFLNCRVNLSYLAWEPNACRACF
jgi:hypothetical protein